MSQQIQKKRTDREKLKLQTILESFKKGKVFEEFYGLFNSSQTVQILNGESRSIDNITLDRYIFIALDLKKAKEYKKFTDEFIDFLSFSNEKIGAFNLRKKTSLKMMSNALNLVQPDERIELLVESWFTAPDGSVLKILIMRKLLQNFFQIDPGGKNLSCLNLEKQNHNKQLASTS